MRKLITKNKGRSAQKANERLQNEMVEISFRTMPSKKMLAGDALNFGGELIAERKEKEALRLVTQMEEQYDFGSIIDVQLLRFRALLQLERLEDLIPLAKKLEDAAPSNFRVLMGIFKLNVILGEIAKAEEYLFKANRLLPGNIDLHLEAAAFYRTSGDKKKARAMLERSLNILTKKKKFQSEPLLATIYSRLAKNGGVTADQEHRLKELLLSKSLDSFHKSRVGHALAEINRSRGEIEAESEAIVLANGHEANWLNYNRTLAEYEFECDKEFAFAEEFFLTNNAGKLVDIDKDKNKTPIFILGMPRSGTTLLEQILSGHSRIGQTGESKAFSISYSDAMEKCASTFNVNDFPRGLDRLSLEELNQLPRKYLSYQEYLTDKDFFVDKDLANFKTAGLCGFLFERAKLIHINRAPMDIILSCYSNSIPGVRSTTDLEQLAANYIYMKKLIGLWKKVFPDKLIIVDYADLVADAESKVREVFDFLELEFEEDTLKFNEAKKYCSNS